MLAEACGEDCGWWRSAVHRVLDIATTMSDSPIIVIGVLLLGMVVFWFIVASAIRWIERTMAAAGGGDLLRPRRGPRPVDPLVDSDGPDRPMIGRIDTH
jgi:hypothetical protein